MPTGCAPKKNMQALVDVCKAQVYQAAIVAELQRDFSACTSMPHRFELLSEIYILWKKSEESNMFQLSVHMVVEMLRESSSRSCSDLERETVLKTCIIAMQCMIWREAALKTDMTSSVLMLLRETENSNIRAYAVDLVLLVIDTTFSVDLVYTLLGQYGMWLSSEVYAIGRNMQHNVACLLIRLVNAYITALDANAILYVLRSFQYALHDPNCDARYCVALYSQSLRECCML